MPSSPQAPSRTEDTEVIRPHGSLGTLISELLVHGELHRTFILNYSRQTKSKSGEKFFLTFIESSSQWRRVTVSVDYRNAPAGSLEGELSAWPQRDKAALIYEAIRESLAKVEFYDSVTALGLRTTGGRLHVSVAEDLSVRSLFGRHRLLVSKLIFLGNHSIP